MRAAQSLQAAASDIKLHHSVFALPFALLGACLAAVTPEGVPWGGMVWRLAVVVACMVFARTAAMLANRLADADIDARNARTARRAIPSGRLSRRAATVMLVASAAAFQLCTLAFPLAFGNPWPAWLAPPVLLWLLAYPFMKRFTWLCHAWLGASLAISVPAAALAMRPEAVDLAVVWWIAGMVLLWVTGFDVIYALQDTAFDRSAGLHSVPSRLGPGAAIWISRGLHLIAALLLGAAWWCDERFSVVFGASVALAWALLAAEHVVLARRGEAGLHMAFFTLNGLMSCVVGAAGCLDVALPA